MANCWAMPLSDLGCNSDQFEDDYNDDEHGDDDDDNDNDDGKNSHPASVS